jgi:hypothetical protein
MLKTISSITNAFGALNYKGTWNASTNSPTLADGTGAKGDYYVVSTAGTQTFGGVQLFFGTGDWIAYNGAVWQRVEGGSDGNFANVTLTSTDAGATAAPLLDLYRDSATPAASDTLGEIEFNGEDSAGNKQTYGVIHGSILSPTSGAEQGQLHFETATAGALTEKMIIGTTNLVINEIGAVFNVRIEGDTDANLFYTDATNSRVGVGTISPAAKLDVVGTVGISSTTTLSGLTSSTALALNASKEIVSVTNTGTGNNVLATSPTLVTPIIGAATGTSLALTASSAFVSPITTSSVSGDTAFQAILVSKFDNDSTTSQNFIQFQINNGGANCGKITANGANTAAFGSTSDQRVKENIVELPSQLANIMALRPVEFDYIESYGGGHQIGFIAQEMRQVYPDVVSAETSDNQMLSITGWSKTEARLVKALQELKLELDIVKAELAILKG